MPKAPCVTGAGAGAAPVALAFIVTVTPALFAASPGRAQEQEDVRADRSTRLRQEMMMGVRRGQPERFIHGEPHVERLLLWWPTNHDDHRNHCRGGTRCRTAPIPAYAEPRLEPFHPKRLRPFPARRGVLCAY